jgi:hypothetical protein
MSISEKPKSANWRLMKSIVGEDKLNKLFFHSGPV